VQVAQTVHAAGETAEYRLPTGTISVALAARDKVHLLELHDRLSEAGVAHKLIVESDGEPMAIGCRPTVDRKRMRSLLSSVPLVR
jgi:hypothetical protein